MIGHYIVVYLFDSFGAGIKLWVNSRIQTLQTANGLVMFCFVGRGAYPMNPSDCRYIQLS